MRHWKELLAAALLAAYPVTDCAGSGYEWGGLGARNLARAGAAVADSDDWTAVYWNPGNIVRATKDHGFEAGLEVFGGISAAKDGNSLSGLPGVGAIFNEQHTSSPFLLGAAGAVFPLGAKGAWGTALYAPLGQASDFKDTSGNSSKTRLEQQGMAAILTWGLVGSYAVTESLSVGAGVDVIYGKIKSGTTLTNPPGTLAMFGSPIVSAQKGDGYGLEGIFGLRCDPAARWSFGAAYRTGADVKIRGDATARAPAVSLYESTPFKFSLNHPPTLDLGFAYRPSGRWTLTFDAHQTFWGRFSNEYWYDRDGTLLKDSADSFHWRRTWRLRAGVRHRLSAKTELLAGYLYDRHAIDAGSLDISTSVEANLHNISAGVARRIGGNMELILGGLGGTGKRSEGGVEYRFTGFQLMAEARIGI